MERKKRAVPSVSDLFDPTKKLERITIRSGAVMGNQVHTDNVFLTPNPSRQPGGHDYVKKYVEEEEALLLGHKPTQHLAVPGFVRTMCEMEDITSIGSMPNLAEVEPDDSVQIVRMVETNQVLIVVGATGCGKTTKLPQFILDRHAELRKKCNIIVTQPRKIAAISVASRVCEERDWTLSTIVGYQVGLSNKTSRDTRLTYCTTGVLREKLVREKNMMAYTHVIIDEIHERDLDTDFLMLIVRKLLRSNSRSVKVILMSATIDPIHFAKYFSLPVGGELIPAPVLEVDDSSPYKVEEYYIEQLEQLGTLPRFESADPYIHEKTYDLAVNLIIHFDKMEKEAFVEEHKRPPTEEDKYKKDVLVFLPGIHEIETMYELLVRRRTERDYKWHLLPLHSTITREEQQKVFISAAQDYRKVILSTNIAESSITVKDIVYIIDFCLTKHLMCDPQTNFTTLKLSWAAHSNCKQRAGRTGRTNPGRVYRMVPQSFYENGLANEADPEMTRCPLSTTVLKAKQLNMGGPEAILAHALDPPDLGRLESTILILKEAGALLMTSEGKPSKFDGDLTFLGTVMSNLPLDIHLSKMIMLGNGFSILDDAIVMAAWMTVRNVFRSDFHDRLGPYASKISFSGGCNSDCITYLHVYRTFIEKLRTNYFKTSNDSEGGWCKRNFLNLKAMREANDLVEELRKRLRGLGVYEVAAEGRPRWDASMLPLIRKVVIAGALYPNYFVRGALGGQVDESTAVRELCGKDPFTTVYLRGFEFEQPGELYAKVFKDILEKYAGIVSNVSFDGSSKVYIEFERDNRKDMPGRISYPVYRAIKMRQLKIRIAVPLLPLKEAKERAEKLGIGNVADRFLLLGKSGKSPLSDIPAEIIFIPSYVVDPNKFWIHTKVVKDLDKYQEELNTPGNVFSLSQRPKPGEIFAAPYPQDSGILYRVQLSHINKDNADFATVLFIDYGNVDDSMPIKYLCEFGPQIQNLKSLNLIPPMAMECTLMGVGPSSLTNKNGVWSRQAISRFRSLMEKQGKMLGEVFSVVDGVVSLTVRPRNKGKSINEILIEENIAVPIEESYRSRMNNAVRMSFRGSFSSAQPAHSGTENEPCSQIDASCIQDNLCRIENYVQPPSKSECRHEVQMKGPCSPLEMNVFGTTRVASGKPVGMEIDSVNSVLLDSNPENPHERLLVAGFVASNSSGSKLTLGHTTLMPHIPGLSALMCLLFSPCIELRRSQDRKRYTGALCGLGFDRLTGEAHFPENDMEIIFDCEITLDDIQLVNKIRFWMSQPMLTVPGNDMCDATPAQVLKSQTKIHEYIATLLNRFRPSKEVETFKAAYQWHQFKEDDLLEPDVQEERAPFRCHCGLMLDE
ncbi:putative ATP-dependent RNA helicase spindle-E [Frankliniella fusca]|uniref:Probable ATP-dependent RNA helicase spindle-E n=1 Tax=Frankliniella fusca TaxID=407009 RepID=A0AAE1LNQ5_9NEOP|nr:putative ATP-dependent RNA helicase spindle-E [Frankliniella fusca]